MFIMFVLLVSLLNPPVHNMLIINPHEVPLTERFDDSVTQWIAELSEQETFADWKKPGVKWDRHPLGPGLHGWIVIITDSDQELGYLVVSADPEGLYHLSEYGVGDYPLFSKNTLYQSLVQHELIDSSISFEQFLVQHHMTQERIYLSPFQNIWLITIDHESYQIDAKTGDFMSIDSEVLERVMKLDNMVPSWTAAVADTVHIQQALSLCPTDPYFDLGWIQEPPQNIKDLQQLQVHLQAGQSLTFVTDLYEDTVLYALAVTGYHQWNGGDPFIALEQHGTRYIPVQHLMETGRYYLATDDADD